jgi:hypothetical protein
MKNAKCKLQMQNEKERKGNGEIQNIKWKMQNEKCKVQNICVGMLLLCGAAVQRKNLNLAIEEMNKPYSFSNKTKYSCLVIPAVLRLFLIIDTGTSS